MSRCGRTHLLESLVSGELPQSQEHELRTHTTACALCRHELNWLEAERRLIRHRAGRDEVQHLWEGVARRSKTARPLGRVLVALAASVLLVLGVGQVSFRGSAASSDASVEDVVSEELQSTGGFEEMPVCSAFASGLGFHCGPAVPASFIASR